MKLLVKLVFDMDLINEKWGEDISVTLTMENALGDYIKEDLANSSHTSMTFIAEDENPAACVKRVRDAWNEYYSDMPDACEVLAVEDDDSALIQTLKTVFADYYNIADCQRICASLAQAYPIIKEHNAMESVRAMNYLLSADPGCGFRTVTSIFGGFFRDFGLFETERDTSLNYVLGKETTFRDTAAKDIIDALYEEDNEYKVVGLDISYYLNKDTRDEFRTFLGSLRRLTGKYVFIFRVPSLSDSVLAEIRDAISDIMEVKLIKLAPQSEAVIHDFADSRFKLRGYGVDLDVMNEVYRRVRAERADGRYYGYKTTEKVVNEIVWEKIEKDASRVYKNEDFNKDWISYDDISYTSEPAAPEKSGFDELNELIGMDDIASRIKEIVSQIKSAAENGIKDRPALHMRFVGAPGTGKTTVARIVGRIFKENGILRKGDFFEYEARSLCGEYVGQTAPKTRAVCRDAYGSVLFLDEAYSLYNSSKNDYGKEALTTLISEMENHRDDMVVIMAGYTDDMEQLMDGNAGLRSRMPFKIEFKSYTREQLSDIFMSMVKKNFAFSDDLEEAVRGFFASLDESFIESKEFSNARYARNLYERTWAKAALRTNGKNTTLTAEDFRNACGDNEFSEKIAVRKKLGFC